MIPLQNVTLVGEFQEKSWTFKKESLAFYTQFESSSFYYHQATCETHTISPFHDEIVLFIQQNPKVTTSLIANHLATICEEPVDNAWLKKMYHALVELAEIDLIIASDALNESR